MRRFAAVAVLVGMSFAGVALAAPTESETKKEAQFQPRFSKILLAKLPDASKTLTARVADKKNTKTVEQNAREVAASLGTIGSGDIDALAFLILMQVSRDDDQILADQLKKMKIINEQKAAIREKRKARPSKDFTQSEIDAVVDELKNRQDRIDDLSQETQMKIQAAQDRQKKWTETLANFMKRIGDTQSGISGNMK